MKSAIDYLRQVGVMDKYSYLLIDEFMSNWKKLAITCFNTHKTIHVLKTPGNIVISKLQFVNRIL